MSLLSVPGTATRRTQAVHHRDQVEQPRPGNVIGPHENLDLGRILATADLGREGISQARVAIGGANPDDLAIVGPLDQQTSKLLRGPLTEVSGRNAGLLDGV